MIESLIHDQNNMWNKLIDDTNSAKEFVNQTQAGTFDNNLMALGGFTPDQEGIYHKDQDALQQYGGYNDLYDIVFNKATSMKTEKFPFSTSDGQPYMIWLWKGDYCNLGAGAEIGIYNYGFTVPGTGLDHWYAGVDDALPITLDLYDSCGQVFSWHPEENQLWIAGFDPNSQNTSANQLTSVGSINFESRLDLWNGFIIHIMGKDFGILMSIITQLDFIGNIKLKILGVHIEIQ